MEYLKYTQSLAAFISKFYLQPKKNEPKMFKDQHIIQVSKEEGGRRQLHPRAHTDNTSFNTEKRVLDFWVLLADLLVQGMIPQDMYSQHKLESTTNLQKIFL